MIGSKEQYDRIMKNAEFQGKMPVEHVGLLAETIEALREVARANLSKAIENWEGAARPSPGAAHNAVVSEVGTFREWLEVNEPALFALPDWLTDG